MGMTITEKFLPLTLAKIRFNRAKTFGWMSMF